MKYDTNSPRYKEARRLSRLGRWYLTEKSNPISSDGITRRNTTREGGGAGLMHQDRVLEALMRGTAYQPSGLSWRSLRNLSTTSRTQRRSPGRRRLPRRNATAKVPRFMMPRGPGPTPRGYIRLTCFNPPANVLMLMGADPPTPGDGYGGFEEVERKRTTAQVRYKGSPAMKMKVTAILDGFADNISIEPQMDIIDYLANPAYMGQDMMIVRISGPGTWKRYEAFNYVIENVEWGEAEMTQRGTKRSRQFLTLHLLRLSSQDFSPVGCINEYVNTYRVRRGDSLEKISYKVFGNTRCAKRIRQLNRIRDPRRLKVGQVLRIP